MKTLLLSLFAAVLLFSASSCEKAEPNPAAGLPPPTQVGRNKAGCLINNSAFIPRGWPSGGIYSGGPTYALGGGFSYDSAYQISFYGHRGGHRVSISLFIHSRATGTYLLNDNVLLQNTSSTQFDYAFYTVYNGANYNGETFVTDAQHTGILTLTHADLQNGIAAGTFEFTAVSVLDPNKTVTITSGRFDRKQ